MADRYPNFAELKSNERLGVDYRIHVENRETSVAVVAPHGGSIEPGTLEIAAAISSDTFSFYAFEALRTAGKRGSLHITSARFDELQALELAGKARKAIAIHGRVDGRDPSTVWVGGLDTSLRDKMVVALTAAGFSAVAVLEGGLAGRDPANICNRGSTGMGVQLELPRTLRRQLTSQSRLLCAFRNAIRGATVAG
jgi:phage replication-related protein YjqB (UPF0714/DUF867 family)